VQKLGDLEARFKLLRVRSDENTDDQTKAQLYTKPSSWGCWYWNERSLWMQTI